MEIRGFGECRVPRNLEISATVSCYGIAATLKG